MIEAELKATVRNPSRIATLLRARPAVEEVCVYRDAYYDRPDRSLADANAELRVRTVEQDGQERHLLTFKTAAVHDSGSKPEHETEVADRSAVEETLTGLGFVVDIAFEKHCRNYRFGVNGRRFLATLVTVPELDGETFLEVETLVVNRDDVPAAIDSIRTVLAGLGVGERDVTDRTYQGDVGRRRSSRLRHAG